MKNNESIRDMQPMDIFLKYKEHREWMLDRKIFKIKKDWENVKMVIPSFECKMTRWDTTKKEWFPLPHQAFRFLMEDLNDLKFAMTEYDTFVRPNKAYDFPNWTKAELIIKQ